MCKLTVFYLIYFKFFVDLFLEPHIFFPYAYKDPPAYYLFDFLDLITAYLDLKTGFFDLKNFFRPKNSFLDFLEVKSFLNLLKTLKRHLFSLQIDEKNNIFNFRLYSKKLPL